MWCFRHQRSWVGPHAKWCQMKLPLKSSWPLCWNWLVAGCNTKIPLSTIKVNHCLGLSSWFTFTPMNMTKTSQWFQKQLARTSVETSPLCLTWPITTFPSMSQFVSDNFLCSVSEWLKYCIKRLRSLPAALQPSVLSLGGCLTQLSRVCVILRRAPSDKLEEAATIDSNKVKALAVINRQAQCQGFHIYWCRLIPLRPDFWGRELLRFVFFPQQNQIWHTFHKSGLLQVKWIVHHDNNICSVFN